MSENKIKLLGIFLMILAVVINPFTWEYLFSPDQELDHLFLYFIIQFFALSLFFIGLMINFHTKFILKRKREFMLLLFVLMILIFIIILLEIILHVNPGLLGQSIVNIVLFKYHNQKDGIYYFDDDLGMQFMKPNFSTILYAYQYSWNHTTDSKGFRNQIARENADIVLIGDSFIYGHGLEYNQTINYFLENSPNYKAYNLARQGDSSFEEMYKLNEYALELKPKYIFYFFYVNDLKDNTVRLDNEEMQRFIEMPVEDIKFEEKKPYMVNEEKESILDKIYLKKIIKFIYKGGSQFDPTFKKSKELFLISSLTWNYTDHAILQMDYISKKNNIEFVIIPIEGHFLEEELNLLHLNHLRELAMENNISLISLNISQSNNPKYFLENDGHFSQEGTKFISEKLLDYTN